MMTLPNQITLTRLVLIPLFVIVFYLPWEWSHFASAGIFTLASITDWLDGYLARKLNQFSAFGAFLDPVADKVMVAVALVLLVADYANPWFAMAAVVIISREIVISALREWMAELGKRANVAVSFIGKLKTTVQMIAIIGLLAFDPDSFPNLALLFYVLLFAAAILTLWSMFIYLRAAWPYLMAEDSLQRPAGQAATVQHSDSLDGK